MGRKSGEEEKGWEEGEGGWAGRAEEGYKWSFVGGPKRCPHHAGGLVPGARSCARCEKKKAAYVDCRRRLVARIGAGRLGAKAACGRLRAYLLIALELTQLLGALASWLVRRAGPLTLGPGVWWGGVGEGWKGRGGGGGLGG